MNDNIFDITRKHGKEMHRLALNHSLEMAKLYREHGDSLDDLIQHLQRKLAEESTEHSRFDEDHRAICDGCRADYHDAMLDMARDAELDALSELEAIEV